MFSCKFVPAGVFVQIGDHGVVAGFGALDVLKGVGWGGMVVGDGCVCHVSHGLFRGAEVDGDIDVSHG